MHRTSYNVTSHKNKHQQRVWNCIIYHIVSVFNYKHLKQFKQMRRPCAPRSSARVPPSWLPQVCQQACHPLKTRKSAWLPPSILQQQSTIMNKKIRNHLHNNENTVQDLKSREEGIQDKPQ